MPRKFMFTREEILSVALELTREKGIAAVTARGLGEKLGTSSKPIFSLFECMEDVHHAVMESANNRYQSFLNEDMASGKFPPYKASGMAYIRFAREEKELFKLLFMRDRSKEMIKDDKEEIQPLLDLIQQNLGLNEKEAYLFHTEMWLYVHGIAVALATAYLDWNEELIAHILSDGYEGLKIRYMERDTI